MFRKGTGGGRDDDSNRPDYNNVAPPENLNKRQRYTGISQISETNFEYAKIGRQKRSAKTEDDYFEDDEEEDKARGSGEGGSEDNEGEASDEEDPLDAFMAGIEKEVKGSSKSAATVKPQPMATKKGKDVKALKGVRTDIDGEDAEESYYRFMEENPLAGVGSFVGDSDEEENPEGDGTRTVEYDKDGNPIIVRGSKTIDPLPSIDHSQIKYEKFEKNFYEEHPDIASLPAKEVDQLRKKLGIRVLGVSAPKPVSSFGHFNFDEQLIKAIRKSEYTQPTPIQAQAIPVALNGRDLIGVAKTGSGKTAAYLWPIMVHIMDQRELKPGDGPIGLVLAPTRELSQQIYTEAKRFGKAYGIRVVCAYGGGSKWEQSKDLEAGAEIVVATPGRLIDMVKMKVTNLQRVTCLVLDEADRMFDMGFEPQVRSICDHIRPDRQTMLFSATFKKKVERLARDVLTDPIKIIQGELGEANEDITQIVLDFPEGPKKWEWLISKLVEFTSAGSVLIFVTKKTNAEELTENLRNKEFDVIMIHGDMDQSERNKVITTFKRKEVPVLVATDVAARGLDIPHIRNVVNYDIARDIDTHTHRIGRTGRAGEKGTAYTLVTEKDKEFAGHLVRNLEGANQSVPSSLMELALQSAWFRKSRFQQGKAKKTNIGGAGLGFKARPGFGSSSSSRDPMNPSSSSYTATIASKIPRSEHSEGGSSSSSGGGSVARMSAMRAAFSAQYKSTFKASSDSTWSSGQQQQLDNNLSAAAAAAASDKPKKRSRWE